MTIINPFITCLVVVVRKDERKVVDILCEEKGVCWLGSMEEKKTVKIS